jgi:nucleoside-diphosphate-sugar epimerase
MMLVRRRDPRDGEPGVVALFGLGLVGGEVQSALRRVGNATFEVVPVSWVDRHDRRLQLGLLKRRIAGEGPVPTRADVVWSAGRGGFGAKVEELSRERVALDDAIRFSEELARGMPDAVHALHFMSSAGGLFEGQRVVGADAEPAPRRPYGSAKLEQEEACLGIGAGVVPSIYRLSSVYGHGSPRARMGLVTTLIANAWKHRTSHIFGNAGTIRDYVLASDIGEFVAGRVGGTSRRPETLLLASGRPATIDEIVRLVQTVLSRKLYVRLTRPLTTPATCPICGAPCRRAGGRPTSKPAYGKRRGGFSRP